MSVFRPDLRSSLPSDRARALHDQLVEAWACRQRAEHQAARLLATIADEGVHAELGYLTVAEYAAVVLDLGRRQARDLLRIGRALPGLPVVDRAFAEGRLSWTKVRELVRVVEPATEAAWVERACAVSGHELEALVAASDPGDGPPTRAGRVPARTNLVFSTAAVDAEVVRDSLMWFRLAAGVGDEVDDGALLAMMLKRVVHDARAEGGLGERPPPSTEPYRVVVEHCPGCGGAAGLDCELTDTIALEAACDAEVVDLRPGPDRGALSHTIRPRVRRAVLLRDGHRCRVPGCINRNYVHVHHIRSKAFGGTGTEENCVTCCDAHHRLVHAGGLGISVEDGLLCFRFAGGGVERVPFAGRDPRGSSGTQALGGP